MEREKIANLSAQTLRTDIAKEALSYLKETRKITDYVIDEFRLGYVPQDLHNVNGEMHEFAGRIVIPIYDQYKSLVALSSRDWRVNAYYKFFHEQFVKSNYLFALNLAKKSILKNNKVIIVEGEFDVMKLFSANIKCVVGMLGSALQLKRISILSRYCNEMYLVFDGDDAGRTSMDKVIKMSIDYHFEGAYGIRVIPIYLPDGADPDSFIDSDGKSVFIENLKMAKEKTLLSGEKT